VVKLNALISDIAASAQEQATGLGEVNTAVNQMDQVTQQNAAMVEQATAASTTLASEAEELTRLVGQFNLGAAEVMHEARSAPRRAASASPVKKARMPLNAPAARVVSFSKKAAPPQPALAGAAEDWNEF